MKHFIIDCILFVIVLSCILVFMGFVNNEGSAKDLYVKAFYDKEQLVKHYKGIPRIIFIGGSNLAFGIDTEEFIKQTGKEVINLGLHAGLGLKLSLDTYSPYIKDSDIVVVAPEYAHFFGEAAYGEESIMGQLPYVTNSCNYLETCNYQQWKNVLTGYPMQTVKYFIKGFVDYGKNKKSKFVYKRSGINSYGDEITHLYLSPEKEGFIGEKISKPFNEDYFAYFTKQIYNLKIKGVRVLIIPPATCIDNYVKNKVEILYLIKRLEDYEWYGKPEMFAYKNTYIYNTPYHLNRQGRMLNTKRILALLKMEGVY